MNAKRITSSTFSTLMRCLTWKLQWFSSAEAEEWVASLGSHKLEPGVVLKLPMQRWESQPNFKRLLEPTIEPELLALFDEDMFWLRYCTDRRQHAMISDTSEHTYYDGDEAIELFMAAAEEADTVMQLKLLRQHPTALSANEDQHRMTIFALWHDLLNGLAQRLPAEGASTSIHLLSLSALVAMLAHHLATQAHRSLIGSLPERREAWSNAARGVAPASSSTDSEVEVELDEHAMPPSPSSSLSEQQQIILETWIAARKLNDKTHHWQQPSLKAIANQLGLTAANVNQHAHRLLAKGYVFQVKKDARRFHGGHYMVVWSPAGEMVATTLELANIVVKAPTPKIKNRS